MVQNYINKIERYRLQLPHNLKKAEAIFKKYNPEYPFEYKFVDEEYARKFENEQRRAHWRFICRSYHFYFMSWAYLALLLIWLKTG